VVRKWRGSGFFWGATNFFSSRYYPDMDTEKSKELWDRLENEPERAYRAFESFLTLPSGERTLLEAYRHHVVNPEAVKPSDTWSRWSSQFAWRERVAAYDDHLASLRREAHERGIAEEAERQGALAERNRNRMNELMTSAYEESMRWFEEVGASGMRASDAIQVIRLHMDYVKASGVDSESKDEDEWTEEDDAEFADMVEELKAEEDPEVDSGEEDSESSRSDETE